MVCRYMRAPGICHFLTFDYEPGIARFDSCHGSIDAGVQRHAITHNQLVYELVFRYSDFKLLAI